MLLPRIPTMTVKLAFTTDYWHFPNMLWYHLHYRPLALLCYAAIYGVFDMDPAMFHAACALLHGIATAALLCLLAALGFEAGVCLAPAFFFASHPLPVEA